MKKLIPIVLAYLIIIVGCHKDSGITNLPSSDAFIREAEVFFNTNVLPLPQKGSSISQALSKQPDWKNAFVKRLSVGEVVIVPLIFSKDLYVKLENGKFRLSASEVTRLLFYKDSTGQMKAEVITTLPDGRYLNDTATGFTGMIWVADWQGDPLRNFRYEPEHRVKRLPLALETSRDSTGAARKVRCAYVDYYYCVAALGYPEDCFYSHSVSMDCEEAVGVDIGTSGWMGEWDYVDVGGGGGGTGGRGVDEYTVLVREPKNIIADPYAYIRCFSVNSKSAYKVILYVDQPIAGTREKITDRHGNTNPIQIEKGTVNVGHTYLTFEQTNEDGSVIRRAMGFYPTGGVKPLFPISQGVLNDDSGHEYDVSLSISVDHIQFFDLLYDCARGNSETYDLNGLNCTKWCTSKLRDIGVSVSETIGTWIGGSGVNPADLGEDLRIMSLSSNMIRNTTSGEGVLNMGNCN